MKKYIFLPLLLTLCLFSCEKTDFGSLAIYRAEGSVDTAISVSDTFLLSFGYFGDEEGISILSAPLHASACTLLNKQWEERILQYIPEPDFSGRDSLVLVTSRGWDGTELSEKRDTISVFIEVTEPVMKILTGKWLWEGSCGGFTGDCWYPAEGVEQIIEITPFRQFIIYGNDSIVSVRTFTLTESTMNGDTEVTGLVFGDRPPQWFWFSGEKLNLQGGDFVETYSRIRETSSGN